MIPTICLTGILYGGVGLFIRPESTIAWLMVIGYAMMAWGIDIWRRVTNEVKA